MEVIDFDAFDNFHLLVADGEYRRNLYHNQQTKFMSETIYYTHL